MKKLISVVLIIVSMFSMTLMASATGLKQENNSEKRQDLLNFAERVCSGEKFFKSMEVRIKHLQKRAEFVKEKNAELASLILAKSTAIKKAYENLKASICTNPRPATSEIKRAFQQFHREMRSTMHEFNQDKKKLRKENNS